jgi:hypothetical protein
LLIATVVIILLLFLLLFSFLLLLLLIMNVHVVFIINLYQVTLTVPGLYELWNPRPIFDFTPCAIIHVKTWASWPVDNTALSQYFRKSFDHPSTVPCIILFVESRDYRASPLYDTVAGFTKEASQPKALVLWHLLRNNFHRIHNIFCSIFNTFYMIYDWISIKRTECWTSSWMKHTVVQPDVWVG